MDPGASRETLDHSIAYIVAVALQDGAWHHERSYAPTRAGRPDSVRLWHAIRTVEDSEWTRRYHAPEPEFGGRIVVTLEDGSVIEDELGVADAHPRGARPFGRAEYIAKFRDLADGVLAPAEQDRFLATVAALAELGPDDLPGLTIRADADLLGISVARGIFDR